MATYYIDWEDGLDSNAGTTAGSAWATIQNALDSGTPTTSTANTYHVKPGVYRETLNPTWTAPTALQSFVVDEFHEQAWTTDPPAGVSEAIVTNYLTDWETAPTNTDVMDMTSSDYTSFDGFRLINGGAATRALHISTAGVDNFTFKNGTMETLTFNISSDNIQMYTRSNQANDILFENVLFLGGYYAVEIQAYEHAGPAVDLNIQFLNCVFMGATDRHFWVNANGASTTTDDGIDITNCTFYSNSYPDYTVGTVGGECAAGTIVIRNSIFVHGRGTCLVAGSSGDIDNDYNLFIGQTAFGTNTSAGANDTSGTTVFPLMHWWPNADRVTPGSTWPLTPGAGSPLIGLKSNTGTANDMRGLPRPGSGDGGDTIGACERFNIFTQSTVNPRTGSNHWRSTGPSTQEFELTVDATSTTISVYVDSDSGTYTLGTRPQLHVLHGAHIGVSDATDTGTTHDTWEELTLTFTPTSAGIVTIRWENGSAASAGIADWDDWTVS